MEKNSKIGLGTANFGLPYGMANKYRQLNVATAGAILDEAWSNQIRVIDTASQYGHAERMLGEMLGRRDFKIVTKTPKLTERSNPLSVDEQIKSSLKESLSALRQSSVYGLLVHHCGDILGPTGPWISDALEKLKQDRLVEKVGLSVYTVDELDRALEIISPDIVQIPFNILDQRFATSGRLEAMTSQGIEVHARSIFLQGVLLTRPAALDDYFSPIRDHLASLHRFIKTSGRSQVEAALQFVVAHRHISNAVVGVDSLAHFKELALYAEPGTTEDFQDFALSDEQYLLPMNWPTLA